MKYRFLIAILFCGLCVPATRAAAKKPQQPNIVVILSDDYGYGSATCYGAEAKLVQTPNIDRLAKEGRRFTDASTTSSVCAPTRYSLLTGRYCWRTSLKHEVLGTTSPLHIEPGRMNLASLLKKHGYRTAAIGKWHLGYGDQAKTDFTKILKPGPLEIGFDYHFGVPANHGDIAGVYVENRNVLGLRSAKLDPAAAGKNFKGKPFLGLDAPHRVDVEVMPLITTKTVKWIESQSKEKPFFLYFTPVAVHNPVTPSAKTKGTSPAGPYGDWIHELDASVGRVLDALDRKGFSENTLVLFTSDNGGVNKPGSEGEASDALKAGLQISGPFRGGKHDVWEGGFRVPYLLRWPGHVPSGTDCGEMLSLVDTLATVAALVGEPLPAKELAAEDSYNMLSAWLGKDSRSIRPDMITHGADGNFAIRRGPWKWIEGDYHPDTKPGALRSRADQFKKQLYNLEEDVAESKDVASSHPEVAQQLEILLNRYRDGDYSRALPPPSPLPKTVEPLAPIQGKTVRQETFDKLPGEPWVVVRGQWSVKAGVLRGNQKGGDRSGAAMRAPLSLTDGDIQYKLTCPFTASHVLRVQGSQKDLVYLISISPRQLAIMRHARGNEAPGSKMMAETRLKLTPDEWADVRVHFNKDEIAAQVGDAVVRAKHPFFDGEKKAMALMVNGRGIGFKDLVIYQADTD
ncbi:MAG: arylsulfatase [Kiritimatiellales bacterium]|nr:arylsulfatase [Kiritimatiellales bacterium]